MRSSRSLPASGSASSASSMPKAAQQYVSAPPSGGREEPVPWGYCHCGCGERLPIKVRFLKGHNARCRTQRYEVDPVTGCWNWLGYVGKNGYPGTISWKGQLASAHRIFYIRFKGPIPEGMELDHSCFNRRCVNPEHTEPVTTRVNARRRRNLKLSECTAEAIRRLSKGGFRHSWIAARFRVSRTLVSLIVSGKRWATA